MSKLIKFPATGLLILTILTLPLGSAALAQEYIESEDASGGAMIYDTVIVRPIDRDQEASSGSTYPALWRYTAQAASPRVGSRQASTKSVRTS